MNLNKTKFFDTDEVYISSRMNAYLKKNFGYEITGDLEALREAKASLEVTKAELKDEYMSAKYVENMLMIETITSLLKAHGSTKSESVKEKRENPDMNEEDVTVDNEGNIAGYLDYIDECIDQINHDNLSEMAYRIQNAVDDIRTRELDLKASLIRDKFNENDDDEELINKVAEWIYHESSEPISEIEYLLKKSGAVGEYMDAVSESKEKVKEEIMTKGGIKVTFNTAIRKIVHLFGTNYLTLAMKKFGINSLDDLKTDADKQKFFNYVYSINPKEWGQYRESIKEDDEEKGPDHYRWKNDSQLAVALGRIESAMEALDHAIEYRSKNSHLLMRGGDKAGVGDLMRIKEKLEDIHSNWESQTEYYGM